MNEICTIILTYNEELNIKKCLMSIGSLSKEIIIVDSFSTDETEKICKNFENVKFVQNKFINQAKQFNWALSNLDIKSDWIMRLDADEEVSKDLVLNIKEKIDKNTNVDAFYLNRRLIWCEKWIKHGGIYPHWIARIFKKGKAVYEERTEEHLVVDGETSKINGKLIERNLKNKIEFFTLKHIETAKGEVNEIFDQSFHYNVSSKNIFDKNMIRRFLKLKFYNKLPLFLRPVIYFLYRYFFKLGFLDGRAGFTFHFFQAFWYRMFIDILVNEKNNNKKKNC